MTDRHSPSKPEPRHVKVQANRVQISYWSQGENRWKTKWTTCMFRPS